MNKVFKYMAAACAIFGLAACSQDRDPVLQAPTKYVLNQPTMQDQYIDLQAGNTLELVSSQPDYGMATTPEYRAQMSLSEDFAASYDLTPASKVLARMQIPQSQIALGLMELLGVTDEDTFKAVFPTGEIPYKKIYFRGICEIPGVEGTKITSNVVAYNNIKGYFAVPVPGYIYLVGAPEGWAGPNEGNADHYAAWRLFEPKDAIGSNIYSGVFEIPAGQAMFRFYTALTGWDADSYGYQVADEATDFSFEGTTFTSPVVKGKGSFNFPAWPGGKMTITVDMSDMKNITMTCTEGEASVVVTKYIYLLGGPAGWNAPEIANEAAFKNYRLADKTDSGIYSGSWPVSAGHVNFRFFTEFAEENGWDSPYQIGAQVDDADVACTLTNGHFSGSYVSGKGNFAFDIENDAILNVTVDTNAKTVTVDFE